MTASVYHEAHLLSLVSTIGIRTLQGGYRLDAECEASLKDIIRYLQKDTGERRVFLQLSAWNVLGKDLIPLLSNHYVDRSLALLVVKLFVFLTLPPEKESESYVKQNQTLCGVLRVMLDNPHIFTIILSLLSDSLQKVECGQLKENDIEAKCLQLTFALVRNLLLIAQSASDVDGTNCDVQIKLRNLLSDCCFFESLSMIIQDVTSFPFKSEIPVLVEILSLVLCTNEVKTLVDGTRNEAGSDDHFEPFQAKQRTQFAARTKQTVSARFNGVYIKQNSFMSSEKILRGKPTESLNTRLSPQSIDNSSTSKWAIHFLKSLSRNVVNQFLFVSWTDLRKSKQTLGLNAEYAIRLRNFVELTSFFVDSMGFIASSDENSRDGETFDETNPVASILSYDFITWLQQELSELEENKAFHNCLPLIDLLVSVASVLKALKKSSQSQILAACKALEEAYMQHDAKCSFMRGLRSRLKHSKSTKAPRSYLIGLFLLLDGVLELTCDEPSSTNDVQRHLQEVFKDRSTVNICLKLLGKVPAKSAWEVRRRVRLLKQLESTADSHISMFVHLQCLLKDPNPDIAAASEQLTKTAICRSLRALCGKDNKGSEFINLVV